MEQEPTESIADAGVVVAEVVGPVPVAVVAAGPVVVAGLVVVTAPIDGAVAVVVGVVSKGCCFGFIRCLVCSIGRVPVVPEDVPDECHLFRIVVATTGRVKAVPGAAAACIGSNGTGGMLFR